MYSVSRANIGTVVSLAYRAIGCVAIVLLALIIYTAWQEGHFFSPVRIGLYGALPAGIFSFFLYAVVRGGLVLKLGITYGAAFVVALLITDGYFQWVSIDRASGPVAPVELATERDALLAKGERAYPHVCGRSAGLTIGGTPVVPVTGVSRNTIYQITGGNELSKTVTDRFGFNNPDEAWDNGKHATLAIIGDSFAFGADEPFGMGFADMLRRELLSVINLACIGTGPLTQFAALSEFGPMLRPQVVVWAYYEGNDLTKDLPNEMSNATLTAYLESTQPQLQGLASRRDEIDAALIAQLKIYLARDEDVTNAAGGASWFTWRSLLGLNAVRTKLGLTYGFELTTLEYFERILGRARELVSSWGGQLVFVYLPGINRFTGSLAGWDADGYRRAIRALATKLNLPLIDVTERFLQNRDPQSFYHGHFNEAGNRATARLIKDAIAAMPSVPPTGE